MLPTQADFEHDLTAHAAEAAADALPSPATDRQRVVFGRIQALATMTSQQASASLGYANAQVAALTAHTESSPQGHWSPTRRGCRGS